tara:strand:+ start:1295 stop:1618 length:324 start_codon:yes stop_codon:yes gene_type:complete
MYGIKSKTLTSTGAVTTKVTQTATGNSPERIYFAPARVTSIQAVCGASAGSVVLKDNGTGGTTLLDVATPGSATATVSVDLNSDGMRFPTDCFATLTNVTSVTVLYA